MSDRDLYAAEVERHVLALREALVRHDENWAAHQLMSECVPYFCADRPAIVKAREDQREMVLHLIDPDAYQEYYANNPHERPFEEQYGVEVKDAHLALPRIGFLRRRLEEGSRIVDLSANDGFMAANLSEVGIVTDCIDLHPGNVSIALQRAKQYDGIGTVNEGDFHELRLAAGHKGYDAVVLFETIEHVHDPRESLAHMVTLAKPNGRLFVSTPQEAVEKGNLPNWDMVERKGHVRVFTAESFQALLEEFGSVDAFEIGADGVMVAEVSPARS